MVSFLCMVMLFFIIIIILYFCVQHAPAMALNWLSEGMKVGWVIGVFSTLFFTTTTTTLATGCQEKCGDVNIPYPFGIGLNCSANSSFTVTCKDSTTPILSSINMEVINISLLGTVVVKQPVSPMSCSGVPSSGHLPISFKETPFTISPRYNSLFVFGCKNSVWLRANKTSTLGGCTPLCDADTTERSCNGVNCCQTTIPRRLKEVQYTYKTNDDGSSNDSFCGYVFPADKERLQKDYGIYKGLLSDHPNPFAPLVLEWEYGRLKGYTNQTCTFSHDYCLSIPDEFGNRYRTSYSHSCLSKNFNDHCTLYPDSYYCRSQSLRAQFSFSDEFYGRYFSNYYSGYDYGYDYDYVSSTKYCSCPRGYEGNPYLPEGCRDIDECSTQPPSKCRPRTCFNVKGHYVCRDTNRKRKARVKVALITVGTAIGTLVLLLVAWKSAKAIRKRIKANRRHELFKRNGGLLLEQQLSATDNGLENTKLYSSKELTRATDHYNENRILGRGGQGTVYKGMLTDGRIVAVKKSERVEEGDLEVFINEVVILSQINHRNVVKLLGCCLETEVPLLVYEFVPNGTLFQHIHKPSEEFPLTWEMRMRIAKEAAGALAYLHSAASAPIYHRDIKSTNILLDDKYRAKISDFGASRSIAVDQTHVTTRVLGTFGYLDPEYFQSNQFTEKSDVYSFGVVMVELLTGEKAISSIRAELGRSLATFFLHSMEENQLFDILDARVLKEGKREEIVAVAHLARRCLHLNGKRRPTMKAVAAELEAIQEVKECSYVVQNGDDSRVCHPIEIAESHNFSSISGSMPFDSIAPFSLESEHPLLGEP